MPVEHPLRHRILAEMHARPYAPISTPRALLRQAFLSGADNSAQADLTRFSQWCVQNEVRPPQADARHHSVDIVGVQLTWERHSEFTTLTWECLHKNKVHDKLFALAETHSGAILAGKPSLIAAVRLDLVSANDFGDFDLFSFEKNSLCMSYVEDRKGIILTDFRQDLNGSTRYAVQDKGLGDAAGGILVRRLLEIETYRSLALLGFEEIKILTPKVAHIENRLVELTSGISDNTDLPATRTTLNAITDIAGELIKLSAASQFRLSATRAYYQLIKARLLRVDEHPMDGYRQIEEFMNKRLGPAMRTCANIEDRIRVAEDKLSGVTELLRTKVDIQMQSQSHDLLESMNKRALLQYRLQTTVEGLSIAAVSYYVVGLIAYLAKGLAPVLHTEPAQVAALAVPVVIITTWLLIKRIRHKYVHGDP